MLLKIIFKSKEKIKIIDVSILLYLSVITIQKTFKYFHTQLFKNNIRLLMSFTK